MGSSVPGCLFPNHGCLPHAWQKLFLQSHGKLVWQTDLVENTLFLTMSPAHPTTTSSGSSQLLPFPGPLYRLVIQAVGPGESKWPWSLLLPVAQPAVPAAGAGKELQSRRDQYLQVADQYLHVADQSTSAPFFRARIKLFEVRGWDSMSLHPESMPRSLGRRKMVEPTQSKEVFGATVVACIHSTLGSVRWGRADITATDVKEGMPGSFVEIRHHW